MKLNFNSQSSQADPYVIQVGDTFYMYVTGETCVNLFKSNNFYDWVEVGNCYQKVGVSLPRTTYDQINRGKAVSQKNLKPGDLVFPHTGHVGIYTGNGKMIHAPQTGDVVKESNIWAFYTARRVA